MKVALIIWTNPDYYTGIKYIAQLLVERGHGVDILCRDTGESFMGQVDYPKQARVRRIGRKAPGLRNYLDYAGYVLVTLWQVRRARYDWIIGFDLFGFAAAFLAACARTGTRLIYHNFDLSDKAVLGFFGRQLKRIEHAGARKAHAVVLSTKGRARIFQQEAGLTREPLVVMNCLRLSDTATRNGAFAALLAQRGVSADKIVVRLGSIGPGHGIEATIRSVGAWQGNWLLVLFGVPIGNYLADMRALVDRLGLRQRVILQPNVSYDLWNDCLHSADLGIALYEPVSVNHRSMAGAGQKLFFYLRAGVPVLVPQLPDFTQMLSRYRFGAAADVTDPASIAHTVNSILGDAQQHRQYVEAARRAFSDELNFEKQFSPVLELIGDSTR